MVTTADLSELVNSTGNAVASMHELFAEAERTHQQVRAVTSAQQVRRRLRMRASSVLEDARESRGIQAPSPMRPVGVKRTAFQPGIAESHHRFRLVLQSEALRARKNALLRQLCLPPNPTNP